jgi:LmbE family N-acetylglucosaminyl deacetylase
MQPLLDRTLIVAPHPDDEAIAAGGLIQRALARGGHVRAVFITDGDNNPWPQRVMKKKWRISAAERAEWGARRRDEARASLRFLGCTSDDDAIFLGYPDHAMASYARRGDRRVVDALREIVASFDATTIVAPSVYDLHADHRAIAWFAHSAASEREILTYVVHGAPDDERLALRLVLTPEEATVKRNAIEHHQSQMLLSRERFLSYARDVELFYRSEVDIMRIDSRVFQLRCKIKHAARVVRNKGAD